MTSSAPIAQPAANVHARILLEKFHCVDATNGEPGDDEIYRALSSGADGGDKRAHRTGEYGSLNTGEWRHFTNENTTLFDGAVSKSVACHIACWEADDSTSEFYDELGHKLHLISEELAKFSELIGPLPSGQWENMAEWIMLGSFIVRLIEELIAWLRNDDDFIQEHILVFDRAVLTALAAQPGQSRSVDFVGDGGVFRLYLKWAGPTAQHTIPVFSGGKNVWTPPVRPWPTSATPSAPVLAVHDNKLYCAVRGWGNEIYVSRRDGDTWTPFGRVPGLVTHHAPALASYRGQLYLAYTGTSANEVQLLSSTNGADWSSQRQLPGYAATAP
ncbi:hypothetical protein [Streptomyces sp. NPDC058664]|uniref:hypothetical protein n=1 Tax=unclassified Streptomyces TaxID=2593676 RepID=UPI00365EC0A3